MAVFFVSSLTGKPRRLSVWCVLLCFSLRIQNETETVYVGTTRQLFGSLRREELKAKLSFKGRQCWRREGREEDIQTRDFLTRFRCLRRAPLFGACGKVGH